MVDLDSRLQDARRRLLQTAGEICSVVAADVALYPEREIERRFLSRPMEAAKLQQATLAELRRRARTLGKTLEALVRERLGDEAAWVGWAERGEMPESLKDLNEIRDIWLPLGGGGGRPGALDAAVEELAASHGLGGDERDPAGYQPPKRFVDRRHLPTLVENIGRYAMELRKIGNELHAREVVHQQQSLAARWAAAAPDEAGGG